MPEGRRITMTKEKMLCCLCNHQFEIEHDGHSDIECPNCGGVIWSEDIYKRTDLSFMLEPCRNCDKKKKVRYKMDSQYKKSFYVCDCSCGRATLNWNHPLSPCSIDEGYCEIDPNTDAPDGYPEEDLECYSDEYAIMEGNHCSLYIAWLETMRKYNGQDYKYPQRFKNGI